MGEATSAKESGTKTEIANGNMVYAKAKAAHGNVVAAEQRAEKAKKVAMDQKNTAKDEYDKAAANEKDAKNDALEKGKKAEATAIQRAVENKNKAGEVETKAYEQRAELRKKQYVRARQHHTGILTSLDKFMKAKETLAEKYHLGNAAAVKKLEETNEARVNAAENAQKHALKVADDSQDRSDLASTKAQEKRVKLDKANAKLKKATDILKARQRSHETASKQRALAKSEADRKSSQKALLTAGAVYKESVQAEKEGKVELKATTQAQDRLNPGEKPVGAQPATDGAMIFSD